MYNGLFHKRESISCVKLLLTSNVHHLFLGECQVIPYTIHNATHLMNTIIRTYYTNRRTVGTKTIDWKLKDAL